MKTTVNSKTTAKPRGKPFPKGIGGNPKGAPKRGESWAEIIKKYGDMTPVEAAQNIIAVAKYVKHEFYINSKTRASKTLTRRPFRI